jgi:hypothetical protein
MAKHPDNTGAYETALDAGQKGYVCIPCYPGTKVPMVKWKAYQTTPPTEKDYARWFQDTRNNIAIITTGLVVFDVDDPEKAALVLHHCGDTPHQLRTPRSGIHLGYRKRKGAEVTNQVNIKGLKIDIRTDGGLEMIPPSHTEQGDYEWLTRGLRPIEELPFGNIGWTRRRTKKLLRMPAVADIADPQGLLYRGKKYVDCFEPAISGSGGHRAFYVAALKIVTFVSRDVDLAWQLLLYYNATKASPPWDLTKPAEERALRHKLADALKNAK